MQEFKEKTQISALNPKIMDKQHVMVKAMKRVQSGKLISSRIKKNAESELMKIESQYKTASSTFKQDILNQYQNMELPDILDRIEQLESDQAVGKDIRKQKGALSQPRKSALNRYNSQKLMQSQALQSARDKFEHKRLILEYKDPQLQLVPGVVIKIINTNQDLIQEYIEQQRLIRLKIRLEYDLRNDRPKIGFLNKELNAVSQQFSRKQDHLHLQLSQLNAQTQQLQHFASQRKKQLALKQHIDNHLHEQVRKIQEYNELQELGAHKATQQVRVQSAKADSGRDREQMGEQMQMQYKVGQYAMLVDHMLQKYESQYQALLDVSQVRDIREAQSYYASLKEEKIECEKRIGALKVKIEESRMIHPQLSQELQEIKFESSENESQCSSSIKTDIAPLNNNIEVDNLEFEVLQSQQQLLYTKSKFTQASQELSAVNSCIQKMLNQLSTSTVVTQLGVSLNEIVVGIDRNQSLYGLQMISWKLEKMLKEMHLKQNSRLKFNRVHDYENDINVREPPSFLGIKQ